MAETADVVIIGAGIIGAATALELSRAGYKTVNIEKLPAAGYGPTSGSCAIIRVHYSTLEGTAFAYEGYFYWREWADYLGLGPNANLAEYRETGCLVMQTEQNGFMQKHTDLAAQLEIPFEIWDADKVTSELPVYDMKKYFPAKLMGDDGFGEPTGGAVRGAVYFPTAGYVNDPQLATVNLQLAAEAAGGAFKFNRAVTNIDVSSGQVTGVRLDDGTQIYAPVVINAAGAYSAKVNEMAGALGDMTITTKALRQEVVHVPAPEGIDFENNGFVISDSDISCYCRPETGNHILVGSEDPECDDREFVDPDDYNKEFTDQWTTQAQRYAQRVPSLGIPSRMGGVVDLYDVTEDWIPIYDKSSVGGFYMAIGTSGNQFKNAPVAGKMMAQLVDYCENGNDHDATPLQFHMERIGRDLDVGFYSRRREINAESSFSVLG